MGQLEWNFHGSSKDYYLSIIIFISWSLTLYLFVGRGNGRGHHTCPLWAGTSKSKPNQQIGLLDDLISQLFLILCRSNQFFLIFRAEPRILTQIVIEFRYCLRFQFDFLQIFWFWKSILKSGQINFCFLNNSYKNIKKH